MDPNNMSFRHSHSAVIDGGFVDVLIVCRDNFTDPTYSPGSDSTRNFESVR
jgi:hypothetical protein